MWVGTSSSDPGTYVWALASWPYAVLHGLNPFFTHLIFAPAGVNLVANDALAPGAGLIAAPITLTAGPMTTIPGLHTPYWHAKPSDPPFFSAAYKRYLQPRSFIARHSVRAALVDAATPGPWPGVLSQLGSPRSESAACCSTGCRLPHSVRKLAVARLQRMVRLGLIARTAAELRRDVAAAHSRDPAARGVGSVEIIATWAGIQALLAHRVAHALHGAGMPLLPRVIAALARAATGIEIHPAAKIGNGLFIDHGMGVVIGETAEMGDDVTLYQGVTLGGTGFATGKRHPTVQDNVTIGSGAKLLGPITVGHGSKIGANTVVVHDVPPNSTVVGNPGHPVRVDGRRPEGPDADWVHLPDPIADAIKGLATRISAIEQAVALDGVDRGAQRRTLHPATEPTVQDGDRVTTVLGRNPAGG